MSAIAPAPDPQFSFLDTTPPPLPAPAGRPWPALVPKPEPAAPGQSEEVRLLRASLASTVAAKVSSASELVQALARQRREQSIPTMLEPLDALLGGGLPRGRMVELTGRPSAGRFSMVLSALAAATGCGEAAVLVDLGDHFDPQIAEAAGVDLRRLLWIRPYTLKQAVMAVEMLAATGFQLLAIDTGPRHRQAAAQPRSPLAPIPSAERRAAGGRYVPDASWVRLARAAEAHGNALLVSSAWPLTGTASEAVVSARNARGQWLGRGKAPRLLAGTAVTLTLEKHRHMRPGTHAVIRFTVAEALSQGIRP
ncbi:MAG: RecA protein [Acidobacteria bacterium]|jgi:hypothetical protein|nr:RecA protein [Acidobacteriota bacterium]